VPFLPLLTSLSDDPAWPRWLCADGLHLNPEGHRQVYERLRGWPALLEWAGLQQRRLATPLA
jgi:lysophospholipase L1-like esterase